MYNILEKFFFFNRTNVSWTQSDNCGESASDFFLRCTVAIRGGDDKVTTADVLLSKSVKVHWGCMISLFLSIIHREGIRSRFSALGNVRFRIDVTIETSRDRREICHLLDCNMSLVFLHFNRQFRFERRVDERLLSTRRALILLHSCRVLNIYWIINAEIAVLEAACMVTFGKSWEGTWSIRFVWKQSRHFRCLKIDVIYNYEKC